MTGSRSSRAARFARPMRELGLLLVVSSALLATPCFAATGTERPPHVVMVMVDTLRADHLRAYGYTRTKTPHLDRFFGTAVVFDQARSQASCTFPSVNSLLTSRHPFTFIERGLVDPAGHDVTDTAAVEVLWQSGNRPARFGIPEDVPSLPQILGAHGYRTVAVSASPIVRHTANTAAVNRWGGFGRGFDVFTESCMNREAAAVNDALFATLDATKDERPLFLYLHYMDPHDPYQAPVSHRGRYAPVEPPTGFKPHVIAGNPHPIAAQLRERPAAELDLTAAELAHLVALYDEEIDYFDEQLGLLLAGLEARGIAQRAIVVVLSDHGESFLEHEHICHCSSVFDSEIRVPLAFRLPGPHAPKPHRVAQPVGLVDVVPTVLELLAIDHRPLGLEGRSLVPDLEPAAVGRSEPGRSFASQRGQRGVVLGRHKLLVDLTRRRESLFDLATDPGETVDLAAGRQELARALRSVLDEHLRATEGEAYGSAAQSLDAELADQLRALGYME